MACLIDKSDPAVLSVVFTRSWGNWHLYRRRWLIWNPSGKPSKDGYDIDLWEIDSHKELVDWLFHVGGKTYDPDQFFEAMRDIFRSAGGLPTFSGKDLVLQYWEQSVPTPRRPSAAANIRPLPKPARTCKT